MAELNEAIKWCIRKGTDETHPITGYRQVIFQGTVPYNMYSEITQATKFWDFGFNSFSKATEIAKISVMLENQNKVTITYSQKKWNIQPKKKNPYWD